MHQLHVWEHRARGWACCLVRFVGYPSIHYFSQIPVRNLPFRLDVDQAKSLMCTQRIMCIRQACTPGASTGINATTKEKILGGTLISPAPASTSSAPEPSSSPPGARPLLLDGRRCSRSMSSHHRTTLGGANSHGGGCGRSGRPPLRLFLHRAKYHATQGGCGTGCVRRVLLVRDTAKSPERDEPH